MIRRRVTWFSLTSHLMDVCCEDFPWLSLGDLRGHDRHIFFHRLLFETFQIEQGHAICIGFYLRQTLQVVFDYHTDFCSIGWTYLPFCHSSGHLETIVFQNLGSSNDGNYYLGWRICFLCEQLLEVC